MLLPLIALIGQSVAKAAEIKEEALTLSPSLCLVSPDSSRCDIQVTLSWSTPQPVCIELELDELHRWCITEPTQKSLALNISTESDVHFVMRDPTTNQQLAEAVLRVKPLSEPQTRRRFRNPWSIF
ncbi:DUF3019 domain-containing protein [Shewanella sp. JM162201]|uniref:DUF3019 domain-containing protein n=1 Tax=Shewanella jiangmenensis TaxID=2837387 RepID=A0ABS5V1X3_9GAMM|nr:DUF3019 domain-containing protein [Shewanella jiangmenensis]MBT1443611.1 DUF3019 domain-containing protein [Shewanella jiangmenensis]